MTDEALPPPTSATARQGGWVLASRIAPQAASLALLVIGGRFLDPAALGSFVLVFAAVELLRHFVRAGWREAVVIDAAGPGTAPLAQALALATACAALIATLLAAFLLSRLLETAAPVPACLALLGMTLLPLAPSVVWEGLLLRRGQADDAARALIVAELVHLACALTLLAGGTGLLALAGARIARSVMLALMLGRAARWPLALSLDRRLVRQALPLSAHVTVSSLIGFVSSSGADLVVGLFLGPAGVAFYRLGSRIAGAIAEAVGETLRVLAWTALGGGSRSDPAAYAAAVDAFLDRTLVLVAPVFIGAALVSEPLVLVLMGEAWRPAAGVVALRAVAGLLQTPTAIAWPVLAAAGRSRNLPRLTGAIAAAAVVLMLAMGSHGLLAVAGSQTLAALLAGIAAIAATNRALAFRLTPRLDILGGLAAMTAAAMFARVLAADTSPVALLGAEVLAGAMAYSAFVRWRRPEIWFGLVRTLLPSQRRDA